MMIRICYPDGRYDMIKASHLERLLNVHRIHRFKRSEGWVVVGRDRVRSR